LFLKDTGELYSFGSGVNGRTGQGNEIERLVPTLVFFSINPPIILGATAGSHHSLAWTCLFSYFLIDFVFESGGKNICLFESGGRNICLFDKCVYFLILYGKISCCDMFCCSLAKQSTTNPIVDTANGDLYAFGGNDEGQCGLGALPRALSPVLVNSFNTAGASAGFKHTLAWTGNES